MTRTPSHQRPIHGAALGLATLVELVAACTTTAPLPGTPTQAPAPASTPATVDGALHAAPERDADANVDASAAAVPPASHLLRDGFEQRHRERALLLADRRYVLPRAVVANEPGRTRLVYDDASVRVLVWAAAAALWETPLAVTALTRHPAKPSAKERVFVGPGAFAERKFEKNGFVRVSAHDRTFGVEGYLPAAALGRVYLPAEVPDVPGADRWVLSRDATMLERPGGAALGKLLDASGPQVQVTELSKGAAWFVEIAYRSPTLSVRGFVPKSALSPPKAASWSGTFGSIGRSNPPEEQLTFASGTCLYAEPWGEVVGVLRLPRTANVHIESGARAAWRELDLPWAAAQVWVPREGASTTPPPEDAQRKPLSLADGFRCATAARPRAD